MEQICYIIETMKGKFKPFIGQLVPDDDDSSLFVIASGERFDELEGAQKFIKDNADDMKFYLNPVKSNESGLTWMSEILNAN